MQWEISLLLAASVTAAQASAEIACLQLVAPPMTLQDFDACILRRRKSDTLARIQISSPLRVTAYRHIFYQAPHTLAVRASAR